MSSVRKHFSLEAANFSLFSQEGEVTSSLQYSLRESLTVLASRMNFFNFPRFYYVVFAWILREFRAYFAWILREVFSCMREIFLAYREVSAHELMFRHMIQ